MSASDSPSGASAAGMFGMRSSRSRKRTVDLVGFGFDGRQLLAEVPALLAQIGGGGLVALPARRPDPLGKPVDLAPKSVTTAAEETLTAVEVSGPVHVGGVDVPAGEGGLDPIEVVAQTPDVDHAATVADPSGLPDGCSGQPPTPR